MGFHWRDANIELSDRFSSEINGYQQWRLFLELLSEPLGAIALSGHERVGLSTIAGEALSVFDTVIMPSAPKPTVFVSHNRCDLIFAERVAWMACNAGIDYWLDVHDPVLKYANRHISGANALYPVLVAGIIEMALLNSSHLVAIHTGVSRRSQWIPYEFGRLRDRSCVSTNCGSWFHPKSNKAEHGDYLRLARTTQGGETDVSRWLSQWSPGAGVSLWKRRLPPILP